MTPHKRKPTNLRSPIKRNPKGTQQGSPNDTDDPTPCESESEAVDAVDLNVTPTPTGVVPYNMLHIPTPKATVPEAPPDVSFIGYRFKSNSCWLDTSLNILFFAVYPFAEDLESFGSVDGDEETCHSLVVDLTVGRHRMIMDNEPEQNMHKYMEDKHDTLRQKLLKRKYITSLVSEESLFVSCPKRTCKQ